MLFVVICLVKMPIIIGRVAMILPATYLCSVFSLVICHCWPLPWNAQLSYFNQIWISMQNQNTICVNDTLQRWHSHIQQPVRAKSQMCVLSRKLKYGRSESSIMNTSKVTFYICFILPFDTIHLTHSNAYLTVRRNNFGQNSNQMQSKMNYISHDEGSFGSVRLQQVNEQ